MIEKLNNTNLNYKFHNEIIEFYNQFGPNPDTIKYRIMAKREVKRFIINNIGFPVKIKNFGSLKTKLFIENSDIDLVIINKEFKNYYIFDKLESWIIKNKNLFFNIEILKSTRLPIIRFIYKNFNWKFDIVINKFDGLDVIDNIKHNISKYPEVKYLIIILKHFLQNFNLNKTYKGGIGSFLLYNMLISFLILNSINPHSNNNLGDIFLDFLEYYTIVFNYKKNGIRFNGTYAKIYRKKKYNYYLELYNSYLGIDVGWGAYKIYHIFRYIRKLFEIFFKTKFENSSSLLKYFVYDN